MTRRKRVDYDAGLPTWLVQLIDAGHELATLVEDDVQACRVDPSPADCADCGRRKQAIHAWMRAVVRARKANGQ